MERTQTLPTAGAVRRNGERTSVLGRYVRSAGSLEWGVLAGVVRESNVVGASLQGELTDWLGLRAEGHYRDSDQERFLRAAPC